MKKLSELEGVSLGIVYKFQPCTAYRVRCALKESPSSHWQASAGSVYPLLARLEAGEFISTTTDENDGRKRKHLRITRRGRQALKNWITAGAEPELVSAVMDPVRSRTFFLDALSPRQCKRYLDESITLMEDHFSRTRARFEHSRESDDLFGHLGSMGAMQVTRARLDWLKQVRERLAE